MHCSVVLGVKAPFASAETVEMIGYLDRPSVMTIHLLMGPAYAVTGGESRRSRTAIAALAQALEETNRVGFCRVVRTKNGEPRVGALLPASPETDARGEGGRHLVFPELPYSNDLQHHPSTSVKMDSHGNYADKKACDEQLENFIPSVQR